MSRPRPVRVALVCFTPELGHIAPLVRIAREATKRGFDATCFLTEEGRPLVERLDVRAVYAPVERPAAADRLLQEMLERRHCLSAVAARRAYVDAYMVPLQSDLARRFEELEEAVGTFSPDLLISDAHVLGWLYRRIATDATHVEHVAAGSHFHCQSPLVRRVGLEAGPAARLRGMALGFVEALAPRLQRLLTHDEWRASVRAREVMHADRAQVAERRPARLAARLATGVGPLERRHIGDRVGSCADTEFFGALDPGAGTLHGSSLSRWLEASGPVALVSLGSMIRMEEGLATRVRRGLREAGLRVLEVGGATRSTARGSAHHRREAFLPQADVLAHPAVRLFVTHAGSGAVQEGLWTGTPMVCIPFVSDQWYNASVVELLGVGRRVGERARGRKDIATVAREVMHDEECHERAMLRSRELRNLEGAANLVSRLDALLEREEARDESD